MSDVYIAFGTLLSLGIVFPGLLMTCWLLFPNLVRRTSERVGMTPGRSFGLGLLAALLTALPVAILLNLGFPPANFLAALIVLGGLGLATTGAAGLAAWMAGRLGERSGGDSSSAASFLKAAIILELAAAFPVVGWFLVIPAVFMTAFGAGIFALLHWRPHPKLDLQEPRIVVQPAGANDVT